jgi:hypothetical protein
VSCARLPIYQAKVKPTTKDTSLLRYYDSESRVLFDVYEDEQNIYLKLQTSYYYSQVKILKLGLTIWLDQKAKKNKEIGVIFPQENLSQMHNMQSVGRSKGMSSQLIMTQLHNQYLLSAKYMMLIGMDGEDSQKEMFSNLDQSDIKITITFDSLQRLNYRSVIPKNKIFTEDKYSNHEFSIGVVSGYQKVDFSQMNHGQSGQGAGKGRGGMGSGHKGGQGRSQAPNTQQRKALTEPIDFRFGVKLSN